MKHAIVCLLVLGAACGKSAEERAKEDMAAKAPKPEEPAATPAPIHEGSATPAPADARPADAPAPEPTTPAEIGHARNQAMIDGRNKDVLKYCDLEKLDDKSNPQALLGCTLAACRLHDADTAHRYAHGLSGPLLTEAKKVCLTDQVGL